MKKNLFIFMSFLLMGMAAISQNLLTDGIKNTSEKTMIDGGYQTNSVISDYLVKGNCDTVFSFYTPTVFPLGVAWDGQYLWHSNANNNNLYKLDTSGNLIDSILMPYHLGGLDFDGTDLLGIYEQGPYLYKINILDGTYMYYFLPTISPIDPNLWGVTYGGGNIWACEYNGGYDTVSRIFKIDPVTINAIDTISVKCNIFSIQWVGNVIYGINKNAQKVFKINPANGVLIDSADWCIPQSFDLAVGNKYLWNVSGMIMFGGKQKLYKLNSDFVSMASINENKNSKDLLCNIYPNPASNTIHIDGIPSITLAEVYDISGKLLLSLPLNKPQLDINSLDKGLYFIKLSTEEGYVVRKFIKE